MAKPELVTAGATRWKGNYSPVRFNAMTHGILSKLVVLAHEDHTEFDDLLAALVAEHQPTGPTEQHLVEELAAIIWRKRRVLLAEGAAINAGLRRVVKFGGDDTVKAVAPFVKGLGCEHADLSNHMGTPQEVAGRAKNAAVLRESTWKAVSGILAGGGYGEAVDALDDEPRNWWHGRDEDHREDYPDTAKGLSEFMDEVVLPYYDEIIEGASRTEAIKAQFFGQGVTSNDHEKLDRHEVHLDRKFERTLAMLIKLKEMRTV